MKPSSSSLAQISEFIHIIRGHKVILDSDLARLYGVTTGNLNKSVLRHLDRFPDDFMFQLNLKEVEILRFQIGISSHGGRRYHPRVFTQEGIAMLSSVLSSPRAIQVNIAIMRAFIQLREMTFSVQELSHKVDLLEQGFNEHGKQFELVFKAIRQLMAPPPLPPKRKIGFH